MLSAINDNEINEMKLAKSPKIRKKINDVQSFHIRMGQETVGQIDSLKEMMYPSTKTEVFRNAVQVLDYLAQEYEQGSHFFLRKKGSRELEEIVFFGD